MSQMRLTRAFLCGILAVFSIAGSLSANDFLPGVTYEPAVPTIEKVLGYKPGERISWHSAIVRYFEALAAHSKQIRLVDYGKTWEGRRLFYAVIASEANHARMESIRSGMAALADPRKTPAQEAGRLMEELPAIAWLAYGVHGNEISSPDASMLIAYHLLAARQDAVTASILNNAVVIVDPSQNPDGRDRFVHNFQMAEGLDVAPSPLSAEHNEPWPGGRTNHYLFDLNRDWFALTQPETRGKVKAYLEWHPQVFVDLHEMGSESTYYFPPPAEPHNPYIPDSQRKGWDLFGRNNAKWFDKFGFDYFTREVYDAFYPGYGDSWPTFQGAIGMTYEQASARGLAYRRSDGVTMSFRDTVQRHFVASLATAETAAVNRKELLASFYSYRQSAIEEGSKEAVKAYVLPRTGDVSAVDKLAGVLAAQGIEVMRAESGFRAGNRDYPAGSYWISAAQPSKRLIRTLLENKVEMDEGFMKEQERRRRKALGDQLYDITAWSLPLLYNVECVQSSTVPGVAAKLTPAYYETAGNLEGPEDAVAFIVPWGSRAAGRFLTAALRENLKILSPEKSFTAGGVSYPRGSLVLKTQDNAAGLRDAIARLAQSTGAEVTAVRTTWVDSGINFGSRYSVALRAPEIAIAWDDPVSANAAGPARFVIERQFHYPVTAVRTTQLTGAGMDRFDVILLPDPRGSYASRLGATGAERLKDWVRRGGTLVALGPAAASYLTEEKVGLLSTQTENTPESKEAKKDESKAGKVLTSEEEYEKAIAPDKKSPDLVPGALLRAISDPDHWVTAGLPGTLYVMYEGKTIFAPIKLDKGVNAVRFAAPKDLLASRYLWEENAKQLPYKPFVIVEESGRGQVIAFTADPAQRAFLDGLNVLLLNVIFRGAAHGRPAP